MKMLQKIGLIGLCAFAFIQIATAEEASRIEHRVQHMTKQLTLTSDQQAQIKAMFEEDEKQRELHRENIKKQLDAILTPEQKTKMEEALKKHKEKRHKKSEPPFDGFEHCNDMKK